MKKRMSILTLFMALLLLVTVGAGRVAKAEGTTLTESDDCYEVVDGMIPFNFIKSNLQVPDDFTGTETNKARPEEPVDFVYPESLNYFGEWLTVTVTVQYKGTNEYAYITDTYDEHDLGGVWITDDNEVEIETFGTKYDVTISFTDSEGNPYKFTGATIFNDPDESNYLGLETEEIYYINKKQQSNWHTEVMPATDQYLSDYYTYNKNGGKVDLMRLDSDYDWKTNGSQSGANMDYDPTGPNVAWLAFDGGTFGVLIKDSSTFKYTVSGKDDYLIMPDFFVVYVPYNIEYYYMVDGEYPDDPDYPTQAGDDPYVEPYRRGPVKILEEGDNGILQVMEDLPFVEVEQSDLNPNPEKGGGYVVDSSKERDYRLQVTTDGKTTLKVYFKQVYEVIYHDNGDRYGWTPGAAFADQKKSDYEYPETVVSFEGTPTKEGYTFLGWSKDPNDKTTLYTTEEVMQFFARDHHDYWAQWKKNENYVVPNTSVR